MYFRDLSRVFFRSYLIGASFNTRGLQNVGLSYAIDPGLKTIYSDPKKLQQARKRYLQLYNTHPFWTPLLLGVFLYLERKIAKGLLPAGVLPKIKSTTVYTLSALGDSFFNGSLFVFWSLTTVLMLVSGWPISALVWGCIWFVLLQIFRIYTFWQGLMHGLNFLSRLRAWDLINFGQRVKMINALVLVAIWITIWPWPMSWASWGAFSAVGASACFFFARHYRVREMVFIVFLGLAILWPLLHPLFASHGLFP